MNPRVICNHLISAIIDKSTSINQISLQRYQTIIEIIKNLVEDPLIIT